MKVIDIINYYKHLCEQDISPRFDWSYYESEVHKFLNQEVEIKKGVSDED
jgi:hypothetical protein